jgi:cobyrinic acid a,c-diamide synthase
MQQLRINAHIILGHSFHHACFDTNLQAYAQAQHAFSDKQGEVLYQQNSIYASFLHLWFASSSTITRRLFGLPK